MTENRIGPSQVAERERVQKLRPTESDFIGRKGYERKYKPDGSYRWRYRFKPNDGHGKLTREAEMVGEALKPFQRADIERVQNMPSGPALTDNTARQRGWSRARRVGGNRVERGIDGDRWCLTTPYPWTPVPEGGNPDGTMK